MKSPRCGVVDRAPSSSNAFSSYAAKIRWSKWDLHYYIGKYTNDLSNQSVDSILASAFQQWESASGLNFTKTDQQANADIKIAYVFYGFEDCSRPNKLHSEYLWNKYDRKN